MANVEPKEFINSLIRNFNSQGTNYPLLGDSPSRSEIDAAYMTLYRTLNAMASNPKKTDAQKQKYMETIAILNTARASLINSIEAGARREERAAEQKPRQELVMEAVKHFLNQSQAPRHSAVLEHRGSGELRMLKGYSMEMGNDSMRISDPNFYYVPKSGVSKHQAIIFYFENRFWIADTYSSNGTYVNGTELKNVKPRELRNGDTISFMGEAWTFKEKRGPAGMPGKGMIREWTSSGQVERCTLCGSEMYHTPLKHFLSCSNPGCQNHITDEGIKKMAGDLQAREEKWAREMERIEDRKKSHKADLDREAKVIARMHKKAMAREGGPAKNLSSHGQVSSKEDRKKEFREAMDQMTEIAKMARKRRKR